MAGLLEMSVSGGVLVLVILAVRLAAVNRLPKATLRLLWVVALCKLLLPLRIPSPSSVYAAADRLGTGLQLPGLLVEGGEMAAQAGAAEAAFPFVLVWGAGAVLLALFFLASHLRSRRGYREALPVERPFVKAWMDRHRLRRPVQVRVSDQVGSPLTYGVLWPVILLPKTLDWEDTQGLAFILAHETAHIRRFDALWKWLLAAALCLHWFNPLVWAMYLLANRDLELSCDEAVVREYGRQARSSYAMTLVGMEERRSAFAPLQSGFSKNALKERVTSILRSRPATAVSVAAALVLTAAVSVVFATSAPGRKPAETAALSREETAVGGLDTEIHAVEGTAEVLEAAFQGGGTGYTQVQYDRLKKALLEEDYEKDSIAAFNRRVNAALNDEETDGLREAYEIVRGTLPENDPLAPFLRNTVSASLNEYYARLEEAYSGKRQDPEFRGEAQYGEAWVEYTFTYRILDQEGLTVGERDSFLQEVLRAADRCLKSCSGAYGEETFQQALKAEAAKASTDKIEVTGCKIEQFDTLEDREIWEAGS